MFGALGDGSTTDRPRPGPVVGVDDAAQVFGGNEFTCALLAGGAVQCWGNNAWGQLGDGTSVNRLAPGPLVTGVNALELALLHEHSCALVPERAVLCWGRNQYGEIGPAGMGTEVPTAVRVEGLP
jgi:alpha-tubulin suppressor-like RCC1 family protein